MTDRPLIIIDPGHGGMLGDVYQTEGKQYNFVDIPWTRGAFSIYEGDRMRLLGANLHIELLKRDIESKFSIGAWDNPKDVSLRERVRFANTSGGVLVSLHSNAISATSEGEGQTRARGFSIWTTEGETRSDALATKVWESVRDADVGLEMRSQGADGDVDYESGFYVLRKTRGPAVLIEAGFHDNPHDALWLLDCNNLVKLAAAIADGILHWMETL